MKWLKLKSATLIPAYWIIAALKTFRGFAVIG